jgi:hypothetical protein
MNSFFWGANATAAFIVGLFFLRFWREVRDPLFLLFASAFWLLCLNWTILQVVQPSAETTHYVYLLRLAAYLLIIVAILDKNRPRRVE